MATLTGKVTSAGKILVAGFRDYFRTEAGGNLADKEAKSAARTPYSITAPQFVSWEVAMENMGDEIGILEFLNACLVEQSHKLVREFVTAKDSVPAGTDCSTPEARAEVMAGIVALAQAEISKLTAVSAGTRQERAQAMATIAAFEGTNPEALSPSQVAAIFSAAQKLAAK